MKKHKTYTVQFRRKREGKTNYKQRLKLLLSNKPRLVIRKSLKNIYAQLVLFEPKGDKVLLTATSKELEKFGWNALKKNIPAAYLFGLLFGQRIKSNNFKQIVLDQGSYPSTKGSRIYAVLNGVVDSGVDVAHSKEILPPQERMCGKHISAYAAKLKPEESKYKQQFSSYIKKNLDPSTLPELFEKVKKNILKGAK